MDYKIVISVIAIVAVLFTSGITFDAFGDHLTKPDAEAILFRISGNGAGGGGPVTTPNLNQFVIDNGGVIHNSPYNAMDANAAFSSADFQAWLDARGCRFIILEELEGHEIGRNCSGLFPSSVLWESSSLWHTYSENENASAISEIAVGKLLCDIRQDDVCDKIISVTNIPTLAEIEAKFGPIKDPSWNTILNEYNTDLENIKNQINNGKKILFAGYSFGGGSTTFIVDDPRNDDIIFDLVWVLDPVGPPDNRVLSCGQVPFFGDTSPNDFCFARKTVMRICNDLTPAIKCKVNDMPERKLGPNIKEFIAYWQQGGFPPFDNDVGGDGGTDLEFKLTDGNTITKIRNHEIKCQFNDITSRCHVGLGVQDGVFTCDPVVANFKPESDPKSCKSGDPDTEMKAGENNGEPVFTAVLKSMNNKPTLTSTNPVFIMEGDSIEMKASDVHTKWDRAKTETFRYFDLNTGQVASSVTVPSGQVGIVPYSGFLDGLENPTLYDVQFQVYDNGWPCDNCYGAPIAVVSDSGRDKARVTPENNVIATGKWDTKEIEVTVTNVSPTVIFPVDPLFNKLTLSIPLFTTDPSTPDMNAGFDYTVDLGNGENPVIIHGNPTDVIQVNYAQSGIYIITVTATDKDKGESSEISTEVATPFARLPGKIDKLVNDGTLNKGQGNSLKSKVFAIMKDIDKSHFIPACKVANAFINEVNAYVKSEKLTQSQAEELIEKIENDKDSIGCNGGVIEILKKTTDDDPTQFLFTGVATGSISNDQRIAVKNLDPGTYSSTEMVTQGWNLNQIICIDNNSTGDLASSSAAINLEEDEYVVCVFINEKSNVSAQSSQLISGRGSSSTSDFANAQARFNTISSQPSDDLTDDKKGSGGDEHLTRPTFGQSHETFETIVDSGFRFNDQSFAITDNDYTPFTLQTVNIGEVNTFEAKLYADKRLKVQEFLFGIPNVGEAHLAELGVEVWYDYNGEIEEVKAVQKSNVIDKETLVATHEKAKCQESDIEEKCDLTNVSMVFLEPLQDKVMAVKAIDYKNRYQITYLNEGVEIAGESLNPMQTYLIPSNVRDGGLIKVTQLAKYSPYWESDDGRMFEMNSFGSFKEINITFERFQDTGTAYTRVHSGFGGVMAYELKRATGIFDADELISELPDYIPYSPPVISERMTEEMKAKMLEQEEIAKKILEESKVQARW